MIDDRIFRLYTPRKQIRPTRSNQNLILSNSPSPQRKKYLQATQQSKSPSNSPDRNVVKTQKKLRSLYRKLQQTMEKHQTLYLKGQISRQKKRLQSYKIVDKEDPQCTFQPNVKTKRIAMAPFKQRQIIWQQNRKNRLQDQIQSKILKQLQSCSFRPKLLNPNRNPSKQLNKHHKCKQEFIQFNKTKVTPRKNQVNLKDYQYARKIIHSKLLSD